MLRNLFVKVAYWFSQRIDGVSLPQIKARMTSDDYYDAIRYASDGCVFLTKTHGYLSNYFIPGEWEHSGIYLKNGRDRPVIIEATSKGVVATPLLDFIIKKDILAIYVPKYAGPKERLEAAIWSISQVGAEYDYEFSSDNKAFYCSELVWASYEHVLGKKHPFELRNRLGNETVIPQDIADAENHWQCVWQSSTYKGVRYEN